MHVAVRELKASLSRVLSLAQGGEVIEVTSRNIPIARILGIPQQSDEGLRRLMASGTLTWRGGKPQLSPPVELACGGKSVSQMLLEDRG
ncbi:MAG: type II toxin-antitoxin system prevent-host-death family antitoxin [Betaproteobacteria bacterium]|jgi:prevent-host-death family protein|nr:type II toxin-antitoxin system prevent-host-death family antitoxin [Betaproteobacteria bacterium]OYX60274.1 MAG: prevent-host-death protein [Comamonadaceae bacterium 32-67-11]